MVQGAETSLYRMEINFGNINKISTRIIFPPSQMFERYALVLRFRFFTALVLFFVQKNTAMLQFTTSENLVCLKVVFVTKFQLS